MASCIWTDEETLKLVEIWGDDAIQAMLEGSRRNKDVFKKIAREMEAAGYSKTAEQCQGKIKKLKYEYKKIKDKHSQTGEGRKDWKFLEPMDAVLGHKPATRPPIVVESGGVREGSEKPEVTEEGETEADGQDVEEQSCSSHSEPSVSERKKSPGEGPSQKRKRETSSGVAKFSRMEELVEKIVKVQEESDKHYMKLEEKLLEMEEQRRKESQDFQLRMMSMLCSRPADTGVHSTRPYTSSPVPFNSSCSYNRDSAYSFLGSQQDDNDY